MARANTHVIDLSHFLDDTGDLADLPGPALTLARVVPPVRRERHDPRLGAFHLGPTPGRHRRRPSLSMSRGACLLR